MHRRDQCLIPGWKLHAASWTVDASWTFPLASTPTPWKGRPDRPYKPSMGRSETTPRAHVSRHHLQVHWKLTPPYIHPHSRPCPHSIVHKTVFPTLAGNTSRSRQIAKTARWCSPHYGLDRTKSSPRITCEHVPLHTWRTSLHPWSRTRPRRKSLIRAFSSVFYIYYIYL